MKPFNLFISCLALLLMTACKVDKSTKSTQNKDELRNLRSVEIVTGTTYISECTKDQQGSYYIASFRSYEINGIKRASTSVTYFMDANCDKRLFTKFSLANSELTENNKLLILSYTKATMTVKDAAASSLYNQKGLCGIYNWQVNVTRDITFSRECVMPSEEYYYLSSDKDTSITVYICPTRQFGPHCPQTKFRVQP